MNDLITRVGVAVFIYKQNGYDKKTPYVLLGKRASSHGDGSWGLPGGHLEFGEQPEDACKREVLEETGLLIEQVTRCKSYSYNVVHFPKEHKHYVTLFFEAPYLGGDPILKEPDKCEKWCWFPHHALPWPLFEPLRVLVDSAGLKKG